MNGFVFVMFFVRTASLAELCTWTCVSRSYDIYSIYTRREFQKYAVGDGPEGGLEATLKPLDWTATVLTVRAFPSVPKG